MKICLEMMMMMRMMMLQTKAFEKREGRRQLSLYKQAAPGGKPTLPAFYHDHHHNDDDHMMMVLVGIAITIMSKIMWEYDKNTKRKHYHHNCACDKLLINFLELNCSHYCSAKC